MKRFQILIWTKPYFDCTGVPYITSPGSSSGPRQKTLENKGKHISSGDRHKKCEANNSSMT
jgi:hypothetical protein